MLILRLSVLVILIANASARAESQTEQKVVDAIKSPDLTVVHLWAPWCSNCQTELKSGGWSRIIKDNPQVKFCFVSVWNAGEEGREMFKKFNIADQSNVTILAEPSPRGLNDSTPFRHLPP